jgi:alanine racemase
MWGKQSSLKTWVEIDAAALRHNFEVFEKLAGKSASRRTRVMAVVKANAYGHGLPEVARILATSGISKSEFLIWFGVDNIDEALTIRALDIKNPILIFGYIPPERLKEVIENDISFSVYSKELLAMMRKLNNISARPRIHIKVETGTNRLGIPLDTLEEAMSFFQKHLDWIEGVYTHFAETENPQSSFWREQIAQFEEGVALLKKMGMNPLRHTASSAAASLYPEARYDMIRTGIGLYGLWPSKKISSQLSAPSFQLKPVLTWKTKVVQIKEIKKGETVGYDRTFCTRRPTTIAILPVGYWDGYDRRLSNKGIVLIKGKRAPIVGNICMNMMMVDVTDVKNATMGDDVILMDASVSADEMAECIGTINYEVVTRINPLIARIIKNETP